MARQKTILAGDIGGTKTSLALFRVDKGKKLAPVAQKTFPSGNYPGLEPVVCDFLSGRRDAIGGACFGVAGPVIDGKVKTPNLPWTIDAEALAAAFKLKSVTLLNDLEATAYGIFTLEADKLFTIHEGRAGRRGNQALIAPGTGLGEAILFWDGARHRPSASEGGHADFAPRDALEIDLLRHLIPRFGHVSYERVVSGPGLVYIYGFLKDSGRFLEPPELREKLAGEDPAAIISAAALSGEAEISVKALDIFVSVCGAEAGNLALKAMAVGGVYIGGGIAPKILAKLKDGTFARAFADKGRYSEFLAAVPIHVVMNPETALLGAGWYAAFGAEGGERSTRPRSSSEKTSKS